MLRFLNLLLLALQFLLLSFQSPDFLFEILVVFFCFLGCLLELGVLAAVILQNLDQLLFFISLLLRLLLVQLGLFRNVLLLFFDVVCDLSLHLRCCFVLRLQLRLHQLRLLLDFLHQLVVLLLEHYVFFDDFVLKELGFAFFAAIIFDFQRFPLFVHLFADLSDVRLEVFADLIAFLNFGRLDLFMLRSEVLVLVRVLARHQLKLLSNQVSPLVSVGKRLKLIRVKLQVHLVLNALLL